MGERLFFRHHREYVNIKEMQLYLDYCYKNKKIIFGKKNDDIPFGCRAFIEDKMVEIILTFRYGDKVLTYIFKKDCSENVNEILGMDAWKVMNQYYKVPRIKNAKELPSASAFLYKNPKYENNRVEAIGYDLNSAYAWGLLQYMPDTSKEPDENRIVGTNEIGFIEDENDRGEMSLNIVHSGYYARWIFKKISSPFTNFVNRWYDKKAKGKTIEDRTKAKQIMNFAVGYCQKKNPFIRAAVIGYINEYVKSLIDENTLYCSTDSLVSLVKRKDIEKNIGCEIGQWKIENQGYFAYVGFNHQWNWDVPSYRGQPKSWFKKGWDILCDELPLQGNVYYLDHDSLKIRRYDNGEKKKNN